MDVKGMKPRLTLCALVFLVAGFSGPAHRAMAETATDPVMRLKQSFVKEKDGKFVVDRVRFCQLFRPEELGGGVSDPFQVRLHAEAPAQDVVSRDNFVSLLTEIAVHLRLSFASAIIHGMMPEQALAALRCETIDKSIGDVDFKVDILMDKDGIVIDVMETGSGNRDRQTYPWKAVFGD